MVDRKDAHSPISCCPWPVPRIPPTSFLNHQSCKIHAEMFTAHESMTYHRQMNRQRRHTDLFFFLENNCALYIILYIRNIYDLLKLINLYKSQSGKSSLVTTRPGRGPEDSKRTSPNDGKVQWATLQRRENARKEELHGKVRPV